MYTETVFWLILNILICFWDWEMEGVGEGNRKMKPHQVQINWSGVTAAWAVFVLYYHGFLFISPLVLCALAPTFSFLF